MLRVVFFGQLKEVLKTDGLEVALTSTNETLETVGELRRTLQRKGELWHEYLAYGKALVAVNQTMSSDDTVLEDGDEIAFFPPVTGG